MSKKNEYKELNELFLQENANKEGVIKLPSGVMYRVLKEGDNNTTSPRLNSVVSVYYKGSLISGKVFDDNTYKPYPDAFRLKDLITGWQIALQQMHIGDKWEIIIPAKYGYGKISTTGIPKNSTLIFEIELVAIA